MIVPSALAHYYIIEIHANVTELDGKEFGITRLNCVIVYGSFRLVFVVLGNVFASDGLEQSLKDFAELPPRLTAGMVIGTHSILAFSGRPDFGFQ